MNLPECDHQWSPWRKHFVGDGWHRYCYLCGQGMDKS